jgi:peptidoglycan/LPS O-acetylase OafA/YrhL
MTSLALRRVSLLLPLPPWRIAAAVLILAAAIAGAAVLHGHRVRQQVTPPCIGTVLNAKAAEIPCTQLNRPGWVDPATLALCLLGIVGAAGVLLAPARNSTPD